MKQSMDNNYFKKYGLKQDPYPINIADNIVFLTPEITDLFKSIQSAVGEEWKTMLINAPTGGGKTVLSHYIESINEPTWIVAHVSAEGNLGKENFAIKVLQQTFPDKKFTNENAIPQLHKFLESCALNNRVPLFIVDDAHNLTDDMLGFVLQLGELQYNETKFHIILFANSEIFDTLQDESFSSKINCEVDDHDIPLLTIEQTKDYLYNRLSATGNSKAFVFSEEDVNNIYDSSNGMPGSINRAASELMRKQLVKPESSNKTKYILAAGIILVLAMGLFIFTQDSEQDTTIARQERDLSVPTSQSLKESKPEVVKQDDEPVMIIESQVIDFEDMAANEEADEVIAETQVIEDVIEESILPEPQLEPEPEPEPIFEPSVIDDAEQIAVEQGGLQPELEPELAAENEPEALEINEAGPDKNNTVYNVPTPSNIFTGIRPPGWIMQQDSGSYMLQIMSVQDIANVEKMMEGLETFRSELSGYTNYTPSGKPRYLLFYGLYTDADSANASKNSLPDKLKTIDPWPRSILSIQNEIQSVQKRTDITWY